MYRGGPPIGQLVQLSFEDQMSLIATRVATLKISKIEWHFDKFASSNRSVVQTFIKLKHSSREFPGSRQITCANLEGRPRTGFYTLKGPLCGVDMEAHAIFFSYLISKLAQVCSEQFQGLNA